MKKKWLFCLLSVILCIPCLFGCRLKTSTANQNDLKRVIHVGTVPAEFQKIVENNTFKDVVAFNGRLLKSEICFEDRENRTVVYQICMMDIYGKLLASYLCTVDDAYHVSTLTATEDGGFLFVLGFRDYYRDDEWASSKGYASRVIKCDSYGNLQFDTAFKEIYQAGLEYCFEKNGYFYLFGNLETPEKKVEGVYSSTDICMYMLDQKGNVIKKHCMVGSDFDTLNAAEMSDDSFVLSISAQSDDGDFAGSNSNGYGVRWVVTVNDDLEIIEKKIADGRDIFDDRIGEKDGVPIYMSDPILKKFYSGYPTAFIDYGDFYMIVSENSTGIYENTPNYISAIWYYFETVYSAYTYNGKLIFRTSVDSSPNYDEIVQRITLS